MDIQTIKTYAVSASITFVGSFLGTFGTLLVAVPVDNWSNATWSTLILSAAITAARTAFKVVADRFIPVSLGGKK
jgi:hypothetical protein